jgi:long-chain acyl-CoA synthetase
MATEAKSARPASDLDPESVDARTTVGVFLRQARDSAERVAIRHHQAEEWRPVTRVEMREATLKVAAALVGVGVQARDRVILMAPNSLEWLVCDMAVQTVGAVTVPIYPSSTPEVSQKIAADSQAVLAIVGAGKPAAALKETEHLRRIARMDDDVAAWLGEEANQEALADVGRRARALKPDDVNTIIYTSGTTGEPKGVVLLHRNFVDMAHAYLEVFPLGPEDESLSLLPYAHIFERQAGIFTGTVSGGSAWLSRGMDRLVEDFAEARPTIMVSVPRMYEKMHERVRAVVAKQPPWRQSLFRWAVGVGRSGSGGPQRWLAERLVLTPLRTRLTGGRLRFFVSGGAPLSREVEDFFWAIGIKILQGYGLTETTAGATSNTLREHKAGTVGKPFKGVEIKIAEDGEILVRGACVMKGYFNNEQATAEVFDGDWFKTGDIGEIDGDGFLTITDRKKDLIKTAGGKYVAPQPIEARLQDDPKIERAVLLGDQRPYVVALIVPAGDPAALAEDAGFRSHVQKKIDEVNSGLGSWEAIKYFEVLAKDFDEDSGELTPTLKVKRRVVMDHYKDEIEGMYERGKSQRKDD